MKIDALTSLPALGALWPEQGGHFAGLARDAAGATFAVIVPPIGVGEFDDLEWGGYGENAVDADHFTDGLANTRALLADKHPHPAAQACSTFKTDAHADWYLPSAGELRLAHMHCQGLFEKEGYYWSSTQHGRYYAWIQVFEYGLSSSFNKDYTRRVRAFRRFVI